MNHHDGATSIEAPVPRNIRVSAGSGFAFDEWQTANITSAYYIGYR